MSLSISCWQLPAEKPHLHAGQLHLWRIPLENSPADIELLSSLLSTAEIARAERLRIPAKKHIFILGRARLRQILARYLPIEAAAVEFCYGPQGKPALAPQVASGLSFNLSHSGNWALLAVTRTGEVGVDLEQLDRQLDYLKLAEQFFSPVEISALNRCATARQRRGFYRLWTAKEARLKAIGHGFSAVSGQPLALPDHHCRYFSIARNYLGAVFLDREATSIVRYQLTDK